VAGDDWSADASAEASGDAARGPAPVDPVHRSTVDRRRGMRLLLIWTVPLQMDGGQFLVAAGGGGQTAAAALGGELVGRLAGDGQQGFPATKRDEKNTELKRRTRGNHLGAQKGGRCAGGADRRQGRSSGGGAPAAVLREWLREEERCERCRGGYPPFIARKGEGEGAWRRFAARSVGGRH
jgi:hypothetical protein